MALCKLLIFVPVSHTAVESFCQDHFVLGSFLCALWKRKALIDAILFYIYSLFS